MIYNASVRVSRSTGILLASRQLRGGPPTPQTAFLSAGGGGGGGGGAEYHAYPSTHNRSNLNEVYTSESTACL